MFNNIVIIGITGVGKTTIGRALSNKLEKKFIDLDKNIELHCGVDIATIFAIEGESGFRERETEELTRIISQNNNYILSLGGGCIMSQTNYSILSKASNFIIQLHADLHSIEERLSKSIYKRPMFHNVDIRSKLIDLYNQRKAVYDKVSNLIIETSNLRSNQVVENILEKLAKLNLTEI